ncbi:MAG: DUF763 domain-containing protein [Thermoplasmata archaeon]
MQKTGTAYLPLHYGKAPSWLFERMVPLAGELIEIMALEYGNDEVLARFSSPYFFQAFSMVIGFDWHSSGTTTVTMGAVKEALKTRNVGIAVVGGKGKESKNIAQEIEELDKAYNLKQYVEKLVYASKMAAKVDNVMVQDGFELYHHAMLVTENGNWAIIQQGLNTDQKYARRYHWLGKNVNEYVNEPHSGIESQIILNKVLDLTAKKSEETRKVSVDMVNDGISHLKPLIAKTESKTLTLDDFTDVPVLKMPWKINWAMLEKAYQIHPRNYEELISIKGIGEATVRALAYIAELVYGAEPSWQDPVKFSFALGGKDGVPYPVNRKAYDESIEILKNAVENAKLGDKTKLKSLEKLRSMVPEDTKI